jgi:hypothetical protein
MPSPFDITTVSNTVNLDNNRQGIAVFTVKNDLRRHIHAVVRVTTQPPAADKWVTILPIEGSTDAPDTRDFPVDNTQQIQVKVAVPADGAPGSYSFKLTVADDANPDDNFSTSPDVLFTVHEAPKPAPHPFPPWIIPAVLIGVAILVLLIIGGYALSHRQPPAPTPPITFSEDFATDPNTSGKWRFYRLNSNAVEDFWDAGSQQLYLTTAAIGTGAAAFANYTLTMPRWEADFRYNATGGDGFTFMFYRDESLYSSAKPLVGGGLGFNDGGGYAIEFDGWYNPQVNDLSSAYVSILQNNVSTHLRPVNDARVNDGAWHNVVVHFDSGHISVNIDNGLVMDYTLTNPNYTFPGVGFSAGTGEAAGNHIVDDFMLKPQ